MPPIKVLLADDNDIMRRAIRRLIQDHPEISLVGEACDFAQTIRLTLELRPQVVLMDLHMPDDYIISPQDFKSNPIFTTSRILAISVWNDDETKSLAESFGAAALLDKINLSDELIPTIMRLAMREGDVPDKGGQTT